MKSILIEKPNQLAIVEREIPTPSAGEVRVKVKLAGICGSDSHIYRGHNPFAKYPRVIGHEFFGVIDAVGEGVESARVGERVAVDPVVSCGHCYPCSIGKPNVCTTLAVLGVHADGGFSEYFPDCVRRETVLHSRKHQFLLRNKQRSVVHLQRACFLLCQEPPDFP